MPTALRLAVVSALVILTQTSRADDAHDAMLYSRYSKQFRPTAYKLNRKNKSSQLDVPATLKDVEAGRAIFSFEGLGEAQVWKLPGNEFPINGALSSARPVFTKYFWRGGSGRICQAEELKVGGKWKRYFGLLSDEGASVVPAEEMELWWPNAPWYPEEELFADMFWGITVPGPKPGFWKRQQDEAPKIGDPLPVELHLRNPRTKALQLPLEWYRDRQHSGPALLDVLTLSLAWAPFDAKHPVLHKFTGLEPIRNTYFAGDGTKRPIRVREVEKLLALDLRDWFKVERDGYYQVTLKIDWKTLELRDRVSYNLTCKRIFTVGKPPKLPTIAAFNETVPPVGGKEEEERLKRIIRETISPKPTEREPLPADVERLLRWSEPVDGLAARIEDVCDWRTTTVLVRLKNTSSRPLVFPTGNPRDKNAMQAFEIHVRLGAGPWRKTSWVRDPYFKPPLPKEKQRFAHRAGGIRGIEADRPVMTLQPGEHGLAFVRGHDAQDDAQRKEFKVVLRRPKAIGQGCWTGVLETLSRPARSRLVQPAALIGALSMPEHFPAFTYASTGINWSGSESVVEALWHSNRELFDLLPVYDPAHVRKEFEHRMRAETRLPVKLFLAVLAARAGSEEAGLFLLDTMKDTDYQTRINVHGALVRLFPFPRTEPPAWVVELSMAALSDNRFVTGLEKTNFAAGTSFTVASCKTGNIISALGGAKCRKIVPLLVERVKRREADWYTIHALGDIGDPRAAPALIECVKRGHFDERLYEQAVYALGKLKVRDAVPVLLEDIAYPGVINALGEIGDTRALPKLRELVSTKGKIVRNGKRVTSDRDSERLFAAKMALGVWDPDGGVARLCEMLSDKSIDRRQRYNLVMELGRHHDPKTIAALINVVKTDPDHYIICLAISALAECKYKAAVGGLIECFDTDFKEDNLGKGERVTPANYRNRIARSLQRITGQTFAADKKQWLKWWQEKGKQSTELK